MDCICYDIDRIVEINETELRYREDRGDIISIDLKMCRNRYLKHVNEHPEEYSSGNGVPIEDDDNFRCVADRKIDEPGAPYFEFYDWPHIRFQIQLKQNMFKRLFAFIDWNRKHYDRFLSIQRQLEKAGWQTYDLS